MAMTMHVDVVSAEELIYSGIAEFVAVPAENGEVGILPRHTPMLTKIRPGAVRIKLAGSDEEVVLFVSGGLLEVQTHAVTVLADTAIRAHDLDEAKAIEAKKRAEEALKNRTADFNYAAAEAELAEAVAQLKTLKRKKHHEH